MKKLTLIIISIVIAGCASTSSITYDITSQPPSAPVDVNGVSMGVTPTKAVLKCSKKWVGLAYSPDGWANASGKYEITAYPPTGFSGQSQSKNVDPCQWEGTNNPLVQFDLGLEKVAPIQRIEIQAIGR